MRAFFFAATVTAAWLSAGCAQRSGPAANVTGDFQYLETGHVPAEWQTHAERTGYADTGRYAEAVEFCRRLAETSPEAELASFGFSEQGRPLPLLILSRTGLKDPAAARRTGKPVVLLQNCIHAGECAGKDACLALARDICITGTQRDLLENVIILIAPIFNADGHERFGPYSRINQNGPREMGWRVTATNLNLNRDYIKADAREMQALLQLWQLWEPDVYFDNHTTNGSDHQYDLFYAVSSGPLTDPGVSAWLEEQLLPDILPKLAADGHKTLLYSFARNRTKLEEGIQAAVAFSPRYSTGYGAVCNRPTFLVEVHALKPYEQRVRATYNIVRHTLAYVNAHAAELREVIATADARTAETRGATDERGVALRARTTEDTTPLQYRAVTMNVRDSDITGAQAIEYGDEPVDIDTQLFAGSEVELAVPPPAAYLVPPQWHEVIERLGVHGVRSFPLRKAAKLPVACYRLDSVSFRERPFEGRFQPRYEVQRTEEVRSFPAGTRIVPMDQPRARLIAHLLEPLAPDSLVAWGLFNAIFEQKEYAESYVMEPLARRMLAEDPQLRAEFEQRLAEDEEFAKSPNARLQFFYRRSPFWDEQLNLYPVARLEDAEQLIRLVPQTPLPDAP